MLKKNYSNLHDVSTAEPKAPNTKLRPEFVIDLENLENSNYTEIINNLREHLNTTSRDAAITIPICIKSEVGNLVCIMKTNDLYIVHLQVNDNEYSIKSYTYDTNCKSFVFPSAVEDFISTSNPSVEQVKKMFDIAGCVISESVRFLPIQEYISNHLNITINLEAQLCLNDRPLYYNNGNIVTIQSLRTQWNKLSKQQETQIISERNDSASDGQVVIDITSVLGVANMPSSLGDKTTPIRRAKHNVSPSSSDTKSHIDFYIQNEDKENTPLINLANPPSRESQIATADSYSTPIAKIKSATTILSDRSNNIRSSSISAAESPESIKKLVKNLDLEAFKAAEKEPNNRLFTSREAHHPVTQKILSPKISSPKGPATQNSKSIR